MVPEPYWTLGICAMRLIAAGALFGLAVLVAWDYWVYGRDGAVDRDEQERRDALNKAFEDTEK